MIWEMSVYGSVMIIIALFIRYFAIHRLPKVTFLVIWGLVMIRLLVPFTVSFPGPVNPARTITQYVVTTTQTLETATLPTYSTSEILFFIWLAGVIISVTYFIMSHDHFRRELGEALPLKNEFVANWLSQQKLRRHVQVKQSDRIDSPLTYGLFKPVIIFPKAMDFCDEQQLAHILTHELVLIKRLDYGFKMLLALASCLHWFNPLVWLMWIFANRDIELACDEAVLKVFGEKERSAYALTLIHMAQRQSQGATVHANFSQHRLEERIQVMANMKKTTVVGAALAISLVGGAVVLGNTGDYQSIYAPDLTEKDAVLGQKQS